MLDEKYLSKVLRLEVLVFDVFGRMLAISKMCLTTVRPLSFNRSEDDREFSEKCAGGLLETYKIRFLTLE